MVAEVSEMTKQLYAAKALDDLLINVVDETLKQVFREEGTKAIYAFVENSCHLGQEEIAEQTKVFSDGLHRLMGSAWPVIEKLILKNMHGKLGSEFTEKEGYELSDYVKELRKGASPRG